MMLELRQGKVFYPLLESKLLNACTTMQKFSYMYRSKSKYIDHPRIEETVSPAPTLPRSGVTVVVVIVMVIIVIMMIN
jgi:hypothetical protein